MTVKTVKLGDVAEFIRGITFTPQDVLDEFTNDSVAVMRTKNVQELIDLDDVWKIDKSFVKNENQYLSEGDLLVSSANSWNLVGKASWIPKLEYKSTFGGFVTVLRGNEEKINKRYLYYWFVSKKIQAMLRSFGNKTTNISNLNLKRSLDLSIPLPPLAEQKRIAALLDTADNIMRLREQAIAKLDELAQSMFDELYSKVSENSYVTLGEILEIQRGSSPRPISEWMTEHDDGVNWIKISDATASDKYIYSCKEKIKKDAVRMSRYVKNGDFLLSNSMSFGRPYILKTDGCIHDGWLLLRDAKNKFVQDYLYSVLCSSEVVTQFKKFAIGAVVKNLNIDAVSKVKIKVPSLQEQENFSEKIKDIELLKSSYVKQFRHSTDLIASLQHQSFAVN